MIKRKFYYSFHTAMLFFFFFEPFLSFFHNKAGKRKSNDIKFIFNIRSNFERLIISWEVFLSSLFAMNFVLIIFISFFATKSKFHHAALQVHVGTNCFAGDALKALLIFSWNLRPQNSSRACCAQIYLRRKISQTAKWAISFFVNIENDIKLFRKFSIVVDRLKAEAE